MPLLGQGALIIWRGINLEAEEDMIRWHNTEHIPERISVPGFLRGRRYKHQTRPLWYLDFYETETVETIRSGPYLARLNDPTPWTQRALPHYRDTFRIGCCVVRSVGRGQGGALLTFRLRPDSVDTQRLRNWLGGEGFETIGEMDGVVGMHLLETVTATTQIATAEKRLRGDEVTPAEPWPLVFLVECTSAALAQALVAGVLEPGRLRALGAGPDVVCDPHTLEVSMDAA